MPSGNTSSAGTTESGEGGQNPLPMRLENQDLAVEPPAPSMPRGARRSNFCSGRIFRSVPDVPDRAPARVLSALRMGGAWPVT